MAIQQAKVPAKNFRELIHAALKFPPSSAVAASEIVHFAVSNGRARASVAGTVISSATVLAMRELEAFSADYRSLASYANLLPDDATVNVELSRNDNQVALSCGEMKLTLALTLGQVIPKPKVGEPFFTASEETARTLKWLASVAEKDEEKPDMCCVYLKGGAAMAGNQKCIAVVRTPGLPDIEMPLSLDLCKVIEPGDRLAQAAGGLMLTSGCGVSQVPHLVQTLKFPVQVVERLEKSSGDVYARCRSTDMAQVFKAAADCVARIPKVAACMILNFKDGKIQAKGRSPTATYRTTMDGQVECDGELYLELPEAEEALTVFGGGEVVCKKLKPKGEAALEGTEAKAFFAPVVVSQG